MRILWIPHIAWSTPQRARTFSHELAKDHEVHVTDWVADFRSARDLVSRRYLRNFTYRRFRDGPITVHGIPRISPALFWPALRHLNVMLFRWTVRRIVARERIDVVIGSFVAPPPDAPRVILDVADDNPGYWRIYGRVPSYADEIAATEAAYLRKADAVVAVSTVLMDRLRGVGYTGPLAHIPNGVRLGEYSVEAGRRLRRELRLSGKVVGLIGNHDKTSEMVRLLKVAGRVQDVGATVLVVGRGAALGWAQAEAAAHSVRNVIFAGYVPPERVAAYFSAVDVGLCPYAKNPASDASSPMRLLAYSAAGSHVVCTDLEEVRRMNFANVSLVEDSDEAFVAGAVAALEKPRGRPAQIGEYAVEQLAAQYAAICAGDSDGVGRAFQETTA